ncbi:cytochrome c oxidase assembly protein COX11, mitochondrial-like [Mya arenaria]|uniref:cytochrome c oxidase assembly protein COX11, mitochondrial-like n=1 Tax=Mya arenaria TaxID=6604 RepID=UPI0022E7DF73|nr:cytochrome c oxidase assembly protein COX11, mitochondrial-like [Mya arenaria]XP_052791124.1 cytochrome c oxidase assembly protein COX11, mitochondrial-like [Mya arenaria]XP_052791125.1 cytochrome c oxidase assembly protein COX11, mitochondrial-like [Mya arenaria]XP_052791126.1 cytochrome c oxidase assembly protein COX11, mitochondrial-like [Mya arenaria]
MIINLTKTFQHIASRPGTQKLMFRNISNLVRTTLQQKSKLSTLCQPKTRCWQRPGSGMEIWVQRWGSNVLCVRLASGRPKKAMSNIDALIYAISLVIVWCGMGYVGVPFYKAFCSQFGFGVTPDTLRGHNREKVEHMERGDRVLSVGFSADKDAAFRWNFKPQQTRMNLVPGETALAFYTAQNPTDKPIIGISTYSIYPYKAAQYFNKIQCFCFEEQILNPHEKVDMPVFFYIDPEYDDDPELEFENHIQLCYTFFEAKEGLNLPLPGFSSRGSTPATGKPATVSS